MNNYQKILEELEADFDIMEDEKEENKLLRMMRLVAKFSKDLKKEMATFEKDVMVEKYMELKNIQKRYLRFYRKIETRYEKLIKNDCSHDLWYLYGTDNFRENEKYLTSRCLLCGEIEVVKYSKETGSTIKGRVVLGRVNNNEYNFTEIQKKYHILLSKYDDYYDKKEAKYIEEFPEIKKEYKPKIAAKVLMKRLNKI